MKRFILLILFAFSLFLINCSNLNNINPPLKNQKFKKFNSNYLKWQKKNIKNYSFILKRDCSCSKYPPILITVKNNQITKAINLKTKKELKNKEIAYLINELFSFIKKSIDKNFDIKVTYDKKYFYPKKITVDKESSMIITDFKVLN